MEISELPDHAALQQYKRGTLISFAERRKTTLSYVFSTTYAYAQLRSTTFCFVAFTLLTGNS